MKLLFTLFFVLASMLVKAQVKLNTPIPAIYWMSDTSLTSTGTFKSTTVMYKRRGFVVYQLVNGTIIYSYLDASKKPLEKKYFVVKDDKNSEFVNFRPTIFVSPMTVKPGAFADTVSVNADAIIKR